MLDGTVMVTGGAGYIGSHAVLALQDAGYGVVVIDNLVTGFDWAVPEGVTLVRGDIADQPLVEATLRDHGIRAIMHFAGSVPGTIWYFSYSSRHTNTPPRSGRQSQAGSSSIRYTNAGTEQLGPRLSQSQKASAVAMAMPESKLAASLS